MISVARCASPEPFEAAEREEGGVDFACFELADAGVGIAAERQDDEVGAPPQQLRLAPQ